ncbi:MAG TPA: thioesterase family protein [Denitromonas sp.]|nr:thioesterase family protein [Denitromonas sp.]
MARIQINLPDAFDFSTDITLYLSHINYGNHLDNAMLLTVVSEARLRFLKSINYTELDVEGVGIIVCDAALQYRSEAHHGEVMRVSMAACDFNKYGCDLVWQMREAESGREVARGKTGILFFDYAASKVTRVPDGFAVRFAPQAVA